MAEKMWDASAKRRRVRARVNALFSDLFRAEDVVARLRSDGGLSEELRQAAINLARAHGDTSSKDLNELAWKIVRDRSETEAHFALALHYAKASSQLEPDNPSALNTLG